MKWHCSDSVVAVPLKKGRRGGEGGGKGVGGKPIDRRRYGRDPLTDTGTTLVITQGLPKNTYHLLLGDGNI